MTQSGWRRFLGPADKVIDLATKVVESRQSHEQTVRTVALISVSMGGAALVLLAVAVLVAAAAG